MADLGSSGGYDDAARLLASARARLAAAAADLALPDRLRLSDWQRSTVGALFASLVRDVEDALRAALLERLDAGSPAEPLRAALASAGLPIALPLLETGRLVGQPQLLSLLLRRAEEHRLAGAAPDHRLLGSLAGDEDSAVAAEAMALLVAQNARFDAFHEPLVGRSDLPAELRHQLVWSAAAALRRYMIEQHRLDPIAADAGIASAAAALLPGYDEGDGVEARAVRLAGLLHRRDRLGDDLVAAAGAEGNLPLLLAALAARAGIGFEAAWELLSDAVGRGTAALLRAAALSRHAAASILFRLAASDSAAAARLDAFDILTADEVERLLAPWRADPAYRAAIAEFAR